ncbi:MAG: 50S ribosomal protein L20 [Candidatus Paceibacterota bacterium]|jgi:large subunit ribosomal protein L20
MPRVKRGTIKNKKRRNLLEYAKGFKWGRKSKFVMAKEAVKHAWKYAYRDRKTKKREKRSLWQSQINSACRLEGISYSRLIAGLKKNKIEMDRKILSILSQRNPEIFKKIVEKVKA